MKSLQRAFLVGLIGAAMNVQAVFAATDALDRNFPVLAALESVERALICREGDGLKDRSRVLRLLGEIDMRHDVPDWARKGLSTADTARFAAALLMKNAGTLYGYPEYVSRGRTAVEAMLAKARTGRIVFRDETKLPEKVRAYYALMEANRADLQATVRQGGVDGRPFWNGRARLFIYPPAFDFKTIDGAAGYRFRVLDDVHCERTFMAKSPQAALSPVWAELPVGFVTVRCLAVDAGGREFAEAGRRSFWRSASFDPVECRPAKRDYADARRKALDHLFGWPEIADLERMGHPDITQGSNFTSYPSKMQSAVIKTMLDIARAFPERRDRAMRIARLSAEYLLSTAEPAGSPLEHFTATYVGKGQLSGTYSGQHMLVYPAAAGSAFLRLHAETKEPKWLETARAIARTYRRLQGEDGTWYLKMNAKDGSPVSPNRLVPTSVIAFFEELYAVTGDADCRAVADRAFASIDRGPLVDWDWEGQFEDIRPSEQRYQNLTKHMPCETALYLLKRFPGDAHRLAEAREILRFAEDQFVMWRTPSRADGTGAWTPTYPFFSWRSPTVLEQYTCYLPIDASAAKLIKTYLALYAAEKRPLDLAKARALADSMVNNQDDNGRIRTYWIPEPGDDDPLAGAIRLPLGGDWFNCMAADVQALDLLAKADTSGSTISDKRTVTNAVRRVLDKYVGTGTIAGVVSVIGDGDWNVRFDCAGWADAENKVPMRPDTLFAIFSMTKTFTGAALMVAIDEGRLSLDDEASRYLPEFAEVRMKDGSTPKRPILIRDLMSHVTGWRGGYAVVNRDIPLREVARKLAAQPLEFQPGETFSYGNAWVCSAAACLEVATGVPYERYLQEKVLAPLGMKDTTFWPNAEQLKRLVKAYTSDAFPFRPDEDGCTPQLAFPKAKRLYPAASGGLFSTPADMIRFSQMLAHHGEWRGRRIISRKTFDGVFAVKQTPPAIKWPYSAGAWFWGDWMGHEGAMRTDQRANLKTGHSRVFFIQTLNKAGHGFFQLKTEWHAACDEEQGTPPTVFGT